MSHRVELIDTANNYIALVQVSVAMWTLAFATRPNDSP